MTCSRFETVRPTWVRVTLSKKQDSELAGRDPGSLRPQARKDVHVPTHTNGFPYPSAGLPLQWMTDSLQAAGPSRNVNGSVKIHT